MDRPPADERDDPVAEALHAQATLHDRRVVARELDRARVSEEVRRVQEMDVQRVALDPFPAVEEATQPVHLRVDRDPEQVLEGVYRGHLVRDRADPADAGDDVDDLVGRSADDQLLEIPRRLEDPEVRLDDLAIADGQRQAALALDPGELADLVIDFGRPMHRGVPPRSWAFGPGRSRRPGRPAHGTARSRR